MIVFVFKQKTAYEMRIRDCSSDVCSSDLSVSLLMDDSDRRRLEKKASEARAVATSVAGLSSLPLVDVASSIYQRLQEFFSNATEVELNNAIDRKSVV